MSGFLLDENLPTSLISILSSHSLDASHVEEHGLSATTDTAIWEFAIEHELIIVTKDSDYLDLAAISGKGKVVLLAVGNLRLRELRDFMDAQAEPLHDFLSGKDRILVLSK